MTEFIRFFLESRHGWIRQCMSPGAKSEDTGMDWRSGVIKTTQNFLENRHDHLTKEKNRKHAPCTGIKAGMKKKENLMSYFSQ